MQPSSTRRSARVAPAPTWPTRLRCTAWSVEHQDEFWSAVWAATGVIGDRGRGPAHVPGDDLPRGRYFPGARLNLAENLLRRPAPNRPIVFDREDGQRRVLTCDQLRAAVAPPPPRCVADGVQARRPGRGVDAERARDGDRHARRREHRRGVLVDLTRLRRRRRARPLRPDRAGGAGRRRRLPLRRQAVRLPRAPRRDPGRAADACGASSSSATRDDPTSAASRRRRSLRRRLATAARAARAVRRGSPFDHPWYVLFSSGTTGVPKCIVHRAGGVLLKHLKEHQLHCDVRAGDRVFYFTTCGWMMWNWLVSVLACEATIVLYDGSRSTRGRRLLFDLADAERLTLLGRLGQVHRRVRKAGLRPRRHAPTSTRCARSAPPARRSRPRVSRGCTTRSSPTCTWRRSRAAPTCAAASSAATRPGRCTPGEIQGPALGMAVDVSDDDGSPLAPGGKGELVCTKPVPVDAARLLGRRRRQPLPGRVLRAVPRRVGARRLRGVDRARRHGHPRPQRRHAQPRRRAHRHRRDLPRRSSSSPRSPRPSRSARSGTATPGSCCSCGSPMAPALDDELGDKIRRTLRSAARPGTSRRASPRSPTCPAPGATSSPSSRWPTPSTAGRSATPRRSPTPRRSTSSAIAPSSRPDVTLARLTGSADARLRP